MKPWKPVCNDFACVFQPYGSLSDKDHAAAGRLFGVCCVSSLTTIKGLTKAEAEAVSKVLRELRTAAHEAAR